MITVLYVDDEPAVLEVTRTFLERDGEFRVDTASSAHEAIQKLKAGKYDALVSDYLMPGIDGIALLKYLRPRCSGMPFILFTGNGSEEVAIEALNAGADYYLRKEGAPGTRFAELGTKIRSAVARRQSEQALRVSEQTCRSLVENLPDTVFSVSGEGIITYMSPCIRRFGYEAKEVMGKDLSMLVAAEDIPVAAVQMDKGKQGIASSFDIRIRDKGGHLRRVHASLRPQTEQGRLLAVQGLFTEIADDRKEDAAPADEKQARHTMAGPADRFGEIYELAPLAYLTLSPDGCISDSNRAGTVLLGCKKEDILGRPLAEFIIPEEQTRLSAALLRLVHSGSVHGERLTLAGKNEQTRIISLDGATVADRRGITVHLLLTLQDITGQVKETAALCEAAASAKGIIDSARDGILVCGPELAISEWNPAMEDITGISAADALKKPLGDMLPFLCGTGPESLPVRALAGEIVATPDSWYEYPASGKRGWVRAVFSPLRNAQRSIGGVIGVVQEISARTGAVRRITTANRLYAISTAVGAVAIKARDLLTLLDETCRSAVGEDPVCGAWIGLFDPAAGILRPVAGAGNGEEPRKEGYRLADAPAGGWPTGTAMRTGVPAVCRDTGAEPAGDSWREDALRQGCRSLAAVPFRLKGETVGVLSLCSGEPDTFSEADAEHLALLGTALSSALDMLDKKTLQRRAGKGSHGSWERTRLFAYGVESATVPFAVLFPDGSTSAVNTALSALLGYTEEELLGISLPGLVAGKELSDTHLPFLRVLSTRKPERWEGTIRKKDGSVLPVEVFLHATTDETSGQPCVGVFIIDTAKEKQRVDQLAGELRKYQTIFETGCAAMLVASPDGRIHAANPAACALFGLSEEALCSLKTGGLAGSGDPRFIELARACGTSGRAGGGLRLVRGDGTPFDATVRAAGFMGPGGQPLLNLVLTVSGHDTAADMRETAQERQAFFDSLPIPVRRSGPDGSYFFNKAWLAFTGGKHGREQGDGWMDDIHPDDRDRYRESGAGWCTSGLRSEAEFRLRNHEGEYRWVHEICLPGEVPDETDPGVTCFLFDIHRQKMAEEARDEETGHFRTLFENSADPACIIERNRIIECNPAAIRLFAGTRDDLVGHFLEDFSSPDTAGGNAPAGALREQIDRAGRGTLQKFPWACTGKDGATHETEVLLTALVIKGGQKTLAIIHDVTALNRAEREIKRFSAYPSLNPNPVIEVGRDRNITFANPATLQVLSSLGMPPDPAIFLPGDFDELVKTDPDKVETAERVVQIKERSFRESIRSVPKKETLTIYAYDITDQVLATDALAYANHKLGILTSITRHDIQNKLTGVIGYLDLIQGSLRDPQLTEYLGKAETSANAIRLHIDFTRDYESLGGNAPVWQEIRPILDDVRLHLDTGHIEFEGPEPGDAVFADPMFPKVLYNLIDNSLRHGVHVRRIGIRCEPAGTGCLFVYEDNGIGIPEDKKEAIFERGFTTSTGPAKSSGLGLFLVREVLAITGITIKETGVPGKGSRFEMHVPPGKWKTGSG